MDNTIIQSLWIGDRLSNNELLCLKSFLYQRHEFHLYAYKEIVNLPDGIHLMDANEILPASSLFKDSFNTYASFADWFRIRLLFLKGGWWTDMDVVCVHPLEIEEEYCFSSEWNYEKDTVYVNNTCIKSPCRAPYLESLLTHIEERIQCGEPIKWGEIGVYLFRGKLHQEEDLMQYVRPPVVFCPIDYFNLSELICATEYASDDRTLTVHLWNDIWRRGCLNKNGIYHPGSLYERLKEKYLHTSIRKNRNRK